MGAANAPHKGKPAVPIASTACQLHCLVMQPYTLVAPRARRERSDYFAFYNMLHRLA